VFHDAKEGSATVSVASNRYHVSGPATGEPYPIGVLPVPPLPLALPWTFEMPYAMIWS